MSAAPATMRPIRRLSLGDLATVWAAAPAMPMNIAVAGHLDRVPGTAIGSDGEPDEARLRELVRRRLARAPELRRRVRWTRPGQGRPVWVDDASFDIARHVDLVNLPGADEAAFIEWAATWAAGALDLNRPLWRMVLVTGLRRGGLGLAVVMHHALSDGIAGVALLRTLLDATPDAGAPPDRPWRPAPAPGAAALIRDAVGVRGGAWLRVLRRPGAAMARLAAARRDLAASAAAVGGAAAPNTLLAPADTRRRTVVCTMPLAELRAAGHRQGGTVNDVLLYGVTRGLRRLLAARGDPVDRPWRASVPVAAPAGARNAGGTLPMVVDLPVGEAAPDAALRRIVATTTAAKGARDRTDLGLLASPLVPVTAVRWWIGWLRRHGRTKVNLYVTNVPGPTQPLWLAGAWLRRAVPIVPLVGGVPLAVGALSYDGVVAVAAIAAVTTDLAPFLHGLVAGLAAVDVEVDMPGRVGTYDPVDRVLAALPAAGRTGEAGGVNEMDFKRQALKGA